jgi:hypothetical protein
MSKSLDEHGKMLWNVLRGLNQMSLAFHLADSLDAVGGVG